MTAKELAQRLDGCEYGEEITREEAVEAKAAGLVVAFGASDDLLEFRGAIDDETGAYEGCTVHIKDGALVQEPEGCDMARGCPLYQKHIATAKTVTAVWHDCGNPCWTIETEIPHETFNIYDDGELFSVGIVFSVVDVGCNNE